MQNRETIERKEVEVVKVTGVSQKTGKPYEMYQLVLETPYGKVTFTADYVGSVLMKLYGKEKDAWKLS